MHGPVNTDAKFGILEDNMKHDVQELRTGYKYRWFLFNKFRMFIEHVYCKYIS